jgi:tRNA-specific 2-thiouridylase
MQEKALIAMSGGVDSAVCALLVNTMGHECVGVTMKLFENSDILSCDINQKACCSIDDAHLAAQVASTLGFNHYVWDFCEDFKRDVIERFVLAYEQGLTPNPCIDCNRYLKHKRLYNRAMDLGFDKIATGHYARIEYDSELGRHVLKKAAYLEKDQSYVLYVLSADQLAHTLFPIGELKKSEVRKLAEKNGFLNAKKAESQDICFVRDGDYKSCRRSWTKRDYKEGDFVLENGNIVGRHKGIINYTIGQRKGLGIALGEKMFVKSIDVKKNQVVLARDESVYTDACKIKDAIINIPEYLARQDLEVKVRYSHKPANATLEALADNIYRIRFSEPQRAISKGQAAVIYAGNTVVGGGTIY